MAVRNFPYRLVLPSSLHADILAKCSFKVMEPCSYVRPWGLLPKNQPGFQLFWHGSWECEPDQWVHQLVSQAFCSYRINLSPFTKDFRGQEAKIEHSSIFLRLPLGSCYSTLVNYWQEESTFYTDILRRKVDLRSFFHESHEQTNFSSQNLSVDSRHTAGQKIKKSPGKKTREIK